ncbi:hypothetical protein OV208_26160 [Corallococcus sp. bb12-1]|uniref:hypothetical protein n=1 Tax=Corallococcus sp. bb12-1 TaxID=2996784 RepID=UPI002271E209|nr:hypothetical protein [Corallococcus sp. bb12-1]MCY1044827.1 hypothetical protein [Corallococcus sp. bb12-1]
MRPERLLLTCLLLTGCSDKIPLAVDLGPDANPGVTPSYDGGVAKSQKGNLRFKGPERLSLDLAAALELPVSSVCNELGQYPCLNVHGVSLGGVDPYAHSVYETAPVTGASAPLAVERTVLSACNARIAQDINAPATAVVFKDVALTNGKLNDPASPAVATALSSLVRRAWLRDPTQEERDTLVQLARDVEATGTPNPGVAWMQAACLAVFSSAEAVFY